MTYPRPDIDTLSRTYLTSPLDFPMDVQPPAGEQHPEQWSAVDLGPNSVEAHLDGAAYFTAVETEIDALIASAAPGRYFYLTAWWLGLISVNATVKVRTFGETMAKLVKLARDIPADFTITVVQNEIVLPSGTSLRSKLASLIGKGVDVRVLAWTSPFAPKYQPVAAMLGSVSQLNIQTILSVDSLRKIAGPALKNRVLLNTCAHPLGAAHTKMIVCGDSTHITAFTGGIDPAPGRISPLPTIWNTPVARGWHDVALSVRGPGAKAMFRFFAALWNEQIAQPVDTFNLDDVDVPTHFKDSPTINATPNPVAVVGSQKRVQVLRTIPQMNFSVAGPQQIGPSTAARWLVSAASGFKRPPLSFAPNGIFEFHVALRKAISKATKYIFIADQAFYSQEVMGWLNQRLLQQPNLKVILVHGADPTDPPSGLLNQAVNQFLLPHLPVTGTVPNNVVVYGWSTVTVHAKVTIIDDEWCVVGSANCMRRSHYTDIEMSVAVVDEAATSFARNLRRMLWARYCGLPMPAESLLQPVDAEHGALDNLDHALAIWKPTWGPPVAPPLPALLGTVTPYPLPMPAPTVAYTDASYDLQDIDSRKIL